MKKEQLKKWLGNLKVGDYVADGIYGKDIVSYYPVTKVLKKTFCVANYLTKCSRITGKSNSIWLPEQFRPLNKDEKRKLKNNEIFLDIKKQISALKNLHCCEKYLKTSTLTRLKNTIEKEINWCKWRGRLDK